MNSIQTPAHCQRELRAGNLGRNLRQEPCRDTFFTDFLHDSNSLSFSITQHHLPRGSITQNKLGLPTILVNPENAPHNPYSGCLHVLNWVSLFPDDFSCIKLTKHCPAQGLFNCHIHMPYLGVDIMICKCWQLIIQLTASCRPVPHMSTRRWEERD